MFAAYWAKLEAESLQRDLTAALQDGIEDIIAEQESAEQFSDNNSDTEQAWDTDIALLYLA